MAVTLLTKAAYARHRGCDEKAVRKAIAEGRISVVERDGKQLIDPAVADIQWAQNTRARADSASKATGQGTGPVTSKKSPPAPDSAADGVPQYNVTRAKREDVELRRAELLLAEEEKRLIERAPAVTATYTAFRQLRDEAMQVGRRVSARCAGMSDAREIQLLIDETMRDVLGSFARRTLASLANSLNAGDPASPPVDEEEPHAAG
jgi:hypothetical protein